MCGRRAALWLTWTRPRVCVWILTGPCTSPKRGRVTLEHIPAGWPRWVAMTLAAPTSESGLHIYPMSPQSYRAVFSWFFSSVFFFSFTCNQDMMDGCFLHCCGLSLLSSLIHQTPRIFTMPRSHSNCSALLFSAFLSDSISLITCSLSPTFTRTGSYLMLQKTQ